MRPGEDAAAGQLPLEPVPSDSLSQLLADIEAKLAPVREWRDSAEAVLRADSATPRADSAFLQLRKTLQPKVRRATETFYDRKFQALIWPDGPKADYLRRMKQWQDKPVEPAEIALANSVIAFLAERGVWSSRSEGTTHFSVGEASLLSWLGRFVTPQIQAFLRLAAHEQENAIADDAALMVTPDELGRRLLAAEHLLEEFPDSPARPFISFKYHQYLAAYLGGLPNTPAFNWRTRALRPHFRQSHEHFLRLHRATAAGRVLAQYVTLLRRNGYRRGPEVDEFLRARWDAVDARVLHDQ